MNNVDTLVTKLKQLESVPELSKYRGEFIYEASVDSDETKQLMSEIYLLADDVLITEAGQPNWEHIDTMKERGFHVGPGERDSFGWVTGVIITKVGKIVFG